MSILILILFMCGLYGAVLAVTLARRGGYHGFLGFLRWLLLVISREAWAMSAGIEEFARHRAEQRADWNAKARFGVVGER